MGDSLFLPGLPVDLIRAAYAAAPGNEIESGKFASPESSAALVANTFGYFLAQPEWLPPLPGLDDVGWPARAIALEAIVRFPWSGGRHPCLDVLIETDTTLIGVESKRFEPFRGKSAPDLSDAYWRPVWGSRMEGYARVRDNLRSGKLNLLHLDAAQLVKHAFGLRTAIHRAEHANKQAVLFYLSAEPKQRGDGKTISNEERAAHRAEIGQFAADVSDDEVAFRYCSYRELLGAWILDSDALSAHAAAIAARFQP